MKRLLSFCLALVLIFSLAGCSGGRDSAGTSQGVQDTQADKGLEIMGDHVTYDPNHLVNDGEPITIDWWVWATEDMFRSIAEAYQEIHPNVTINVINNPWDGFFTKLPLALQRDEEGPTLFNVHNSYEHLLLNYMEPYAIDTDELVADYPSASTHLMDGNVYYMDYGLSTGMYYYNKDLSADTKVAKAVVGKGVNTVKMEGDTLEFSQNETAKVPAGTLKGGTDIKEYVQFAESKGLINLDTTLDTVKYSISVDPKMSFELKAGDSVEVWYFVTYESYGETIRERGSVPLTADADK